MTTADTMRLTFEEWQALPECWLASFADRNVRVMRLDLGGATTVATYGMGEVLRSEVLPGFELAVDDVYGPLLGLE